MPAGLQVFGADGSVKLDTSSRISTVVAIVRALGANGSYTDSLLSEGTPFAFFSTTSLRRGVTYSFSGNNFIWAQASTMYTVDGYFVLGIY